MTCCAGRDRINCNPSQKKNYMSLKSDVSWSYRWQFHEYATRFLASKDLQELNYVDSVERKSSKNLAVIIPNGMIGLSLSVFMDINSGHNGGLWQSTSFWRFNKHHDVCTVAPSTKRVCAIPDKASVSISLPSLLMRSRRACNLFALLMLERLLMEQCPTRHENEINFYSNILTMKQ